MLRQVVLLSVVLLVLASSALADALTFTTEQDYKDGLAAKYGVAAEDVADFQGWDSFESGTQIEFGQSVDSVRHYATTSLFKYTFQSTAGTTSQWGSRSPDIALGLDIFGKTVLPFTEINAVTFQFNHAIDSFGISFLNQFDWTGDQRYAITTNNSLTGESVTVATGPDPFYDDRGKFAGIISDNYFDSVTISVTAGSSGWIDPFVLDNMWSTKATSGDLILAYNDDGVMSLAKVGELVNFALENPAVNTDFDSLVMSNTYTGEGASAAVYLNGEFPTNSLHSFTSSLSLYSQDFQDAFAAAMADLSSGGFMFTNYVQELIAEGDPRPELHALLGANFPELGTAIEGIPEDVFTGFIVSMSPNTVFDPFLGKFVAADPNFANEVGMNINELYADVGVGGSIEEVIFPHDPVLGNPISFFLSGSVDGVISGGDLSANVVPEPGTLVTLGAAAALAFVAVRRRRRRAA